MTYLLDTNILILMVRGLKLYRNPNEKQHQRQSLAAHIVRQARQRQQSGDTVALSAITVAELQFGAWNSEDRDKEIAAVQRALTPFLLVAFDPENCAAEYGRVSYLLEAVGKGIGSLDTLIAAHALGLGAVLVTTDSAEFSRVPGLRCENWAA